MDHQNRALAAAAAAPTDPCPDDAFAYLMDYGTGKSQVILDEWGTMAEAGGVEDLLVVAPAGSYRNWFEDKGDLQRAEIAHMDPAFRERMAVAHWSSGAGREHRRRLEEFLRIDDRPRALFVNIEAISSVEKCRDLVREYVSQRLCYGAVDESTCIKGGGRKNKRVRFMHEIANELAVRRIATGLLTPQGPMDAFSQFAFLSRKILGCRSRADFQGRYAVTRPMTVNKRTFDVIVDYRDLDDLHERMAPYSYRVLKSECLDLEPKKYVLWETEHTPEQARLYRELRDDALAVLESGEHVTTDMVMTRVMRLHQINAGFVVDEERRVHDVPSNRERDLCEMLGQHRGKAVIWTAHRRPVARIREALEREFGGGSRSVAEFHGGNVRQRPEEERRFIGDPDCRFMIATPQAAGRGNTWTCADLEIYHSNTNSLEDRYNSEDRLHRKGQTNRVTVVDVVVPDTVDMKIVARLRKKIDMATTLTGEEAREWLI